MGRALAWVPAYLAARWLLAALSPLPHALPMDPWIVFVVLAHRRAGTPALPLLWLGLVLGDLLTGLPPTGLLFRAAGAGALLALPRVSSRHDLFVLAVHGAAWTALPPEFRGEHAFAYAYVLALCQGLLWAGLVWPWTPGRLERASWALAIPPAYAMLVHRFCPGPDLWPPPGLAQCGGTALRVFASLLPCFPFALPAVRVLRKRRRRVPGGLGSQLAKAPD